MLTYILKRIALMLPVLIGVLLLAFLLTYLAPGDPATLLAGGERATQTEIDAMREQLGLNDPFAVRFFNYVKDLVTKGELGISYKTGLSVSTEVAQRFPATLKIASLSCVVAIIIGIPCGIISATRQYSIWDNITVFISLIGVSLPSFWLALMCILLFSIRLGWFPSSGFYGFKYWILPCFCIGVGMAATIMRTTRSSMLEVIRQDYIRTARAKGQKESRVILRHALKNALIPVVTVAGLQFRGLLGGAVLTETIFVIPGLGQYIVSAIKTRDYPVIQGGVLILALISSVVNLLVDILYAFIDPRIRAQYRGSGARTKRPRKEAETEHA